MHICKRSILTHLVCFVTAISIVIGLTGCSGSPSPSDTEQSDTANPLNTDQPDTPNSLSEMDFVSGDDEVVITFSYDEYAYSLFKPLMEAFHEENPSITVQFVSLDSTNYGESTTVEDLLLATASSADTSLTSICSIGMSGYFLDLQPLIDMDSSFNREDFWPGSLSALEDTEGRVLGLPMTLFMRGIFYDKAAFETANLSYPQPGWTWEDFRGTAAVLAQVQDGDIRYGYADRSSASILQPLIGYDLAVTDGEIDAEVLAADLDWYVRMAREDQIMGMQKSDEFLSGLFKHWAPPAMWYGNLFEFILGSITGEAEATDLMTHFTESAYGFAPFPVDADGGNGNTTPVSALCGVISAGTEHPVEAWKWLDFLSRHWLVTSTSYPGELLKIPARQSVAEAEGFWANYPADVREAMRYGLEHAWFSTLYSREESAVLDAVRDTVEGRVTDLVGVLEDAETAQASWPQEMIDTPEVVVATPQPTEDESLGAITIQFNYNDWVPEDVQVYELLISQFNQEHQGEIFVEADHNQDELYPRGYYVEKSNSYDCYLTQAVRYGAEKAVLSGAVLDLTALFEGEDSTFQQDFDNYLLDASRYKGYLTALPLSTQPAIMVYNADLLNEQGLQAPTLDWTFDDFLGLITAVTSTSGSDKHYGFLPSTNAANPLDMLYAGHGLQWRDITGTSPVVLLNTPQMAGTLSWYNELEQTGVVYQITNEEDWELGIGMPVRSGQISFFITYAEEEEEMYFSFIEPPFTLGIAPLPDTDKPNGAFARNYITGFFISKYSENPEACWEFAKYLLEHTEVLNGVPARTSIANSLTWEAQIGAEKAAVYRKALSNNLTNIEADPYGAYYWSPIRSWIGQATMNIRDGNNPTQELALAQQYADAYIECMAAFDIVNLDTDELSEATQNCALQVDPSY